MSSSVRREKIQHNSAVVEAIAWYWVKELATMRYFLEDRDIELLPRWTKCLTVFQWSVVGQCINWDNLLTAYEISRWVRHKYWRLPTTLMYSKRFVKVVLEKVVSVGLAVSGGLIDFAPIIFVWERRSMIYFC